MPGGVLVNLKRSMYLECLLEQLVRSVYLVCPAHFEFSVYLECTYGGALGVLCAAGDCI